MRTTNILLHKKTAHFYIWRIMSINKVFTMHFQLKCGCDAPLRDVGKRKQKLKLERGDEK